jgi:hypothetical protein
MSALVKVIGIKPPKGSNTGVKVGKVYEKSASVAKILIDRKLCELVTDKKK